jgi:hypothetical protein
MQVTRAQVQTYSCPSCGAGVGKSCVGARGKPRLSNHAERVQAYSERKGKG